MNNAIVCLTRGYKNLNSYDSLLKRNLAIFKFFGNKYPVIIFHEGNINESHQRYIVDKSGGLNIQFEDISKVWTGGYESMCKFNAYWLWEYCSQYDNILRIDEDCWLSKVDQDPFELMGDNVYLKTVYWAESHSETNATLPHTIEVLTGAKKEDFYNDKFPYTNVSLSSVSFWRQPNIAEVLAQIALSPSQYINRWGDLPILGALLNIYAKGRVGTTIGLSYYHHSHDVTVHSAE